MKSILIALFVVSATCIAFSQDRPPRDPITAGLFPPELIMNNQSALNLTDAQRSDIQTEIKKTQAKFTDVQWQLKKEAESLSLLLRADKIDEQQAMTQLEKVMSMEREVKKAQMMMMIRIKNVLTAEQQTSLRKIKAEGDARLREKMGLER